MKRPCILVSACLLGKNCKYNGSNNYNKRIEEYTKDYDVIMICPEVMAGLGIPREVLEIKDDHLITKEGKDYTKNMQDACDEIKKLIKERKPALAILKARSPSCGKGEIYDGTFTHTKVFKNGMACDVILKEGIKVLSEEEIEEKI